MEKQWFFSESTIVRKLGGRTVACFLARRAHKPHRKPRSRQPTTTAPQTQDQLTRTPNSLVGRSNRHRSRIRKTEAKNREQHRDRGRIISVECCPADVEVLEVCARRTRGKIDRTVVVILIWGIGDYCFDRNCVTSESSFFQPQRGIPAIKIPTPFFPSKRRYT